jgi:hypothetical protein
MGQSRHLPPTRRAGTAVVAVVALGATLSLSGCGSSVAAATTVLQGIPGNGSVTVTHADGSSVRGVNGLRLRPSDVVRVGDAVSDRAELFTRSRVVYLAPQSSIQVLNGAHQLLRHGAAVVDAQHGPGLQLDLAGLTLTTPSGAAVRAERSVTVRIGALAGNADVESSVGRHLTIPALSQTVLGGDALPDTLTPLQLTDDDGEAHAVPALVRDDKSLRSLAAGIDSTGGAAARIVTASWHGPLISAPAGTARSEQVLPLVIAAAGGGNDEAGRYRDAVSLRAAGGSWGVVAHRVGVGATSVLTAFAEFAAGRASGQVGTVPGVFVAPNVSGRPGTTGQGPGGGGGNGGPGGGGGGGGGSPTPSPSPSPSSSPGVVGTVTELVGGVLGLLPTPTPTISLPALPLKPPVTSLLQPLPHPVP